MSRASRRNNRSVPPRNSANGGQSTRKRKPAGPQLVYSAEDEELMRDQHVKSKNPFEPKTKRQGDMVASIKSNNLTFAVGYAGTGKTYVAVETACTMFNAGIIRNIVLTRPTLEAGTPLGFLPGELNEKIDPYFIPMKAVMEMRLGKSKVEYLIKAKRILIEPLAFLRGKTFDNAVMILDEAQNTTPSTMELFLSRVGMFTNMVVCGDSKRQVDLPRGTISGLPDAVRRFKDIPSVGMISFQTEDIVRSGFCRTVIEAYDN